MFIKLQDDHFTINGYVAACHCKCSHCLLCSGDNKISKIDFERLKKLALKFKGINKKYAFWWEPTAWQNTIIFRFTYKCNVKIININSKYYKSTIFFNRAISYNSYLKQSFWNFRNSAQWTVQNRFKNNYAKIDYKLIITFKKMKKVLILCV